MKTLPVKGHQAGERADQIGKVSKEPLALRDMGVKARQIKALKMAQAAMQDAQTVVAGGAAKVIALEQNRPEPVPRRLERDHDTVDTAAHHHQVVAFSRQGVEVTDGQHGIAKQGSKHLRDAVGNVTSAEVAAQAMPE